jgi:hypothetical protein
VRAHYVNHLLDVKGEPIVGATVYVYDQGTTSPIAATIYTVDDTVGNTTTTNPLTTDSSGKVEFYLNDEARVDLLISKTGLTSRTLTVDVLEIGGGGGGATTLDGLSDVVITTPADDQYLRYNGTNWVNESVAAGGGATALPGLTDVDDATVATSGHVLRGNGTAWVNSAIQDADLPASITRDSEAVLDGDAAGGVLSGTYPNPGFAVDMATQAELNALTKTVRLPHAWALNGTGAVDTLPGFYVSLPAGQTAKIVAARYATASGTATVSVRRNGTNLTDLTGLAVSSTAATTDEDPDVTLADNDYIDLNITAASSPVDLRLTVWVEYTV